MAQVLIIDDDRGIASLLSDLVKYLGQCATCAFSLKEGLDKALSHPFDVVLLDVRLPDGNGLEIIPQILDTPACPEVIIMTGFGDPDGAELAIKSGAWDYLQKPFSTREMILPLNRVFQYRENLRKLQKPVVMLNSDGIIGSSSQMKACFELMAQAANSEANVLLTGETGTGKELFAKAIHSNSSRAAGNLVVVDCAALPETLVESSLFGHEKGAFTGAEKARTGLIKQADGGTLFLDEVGELPMSIQKSFLRVLQERRFRPLACRTEIASSFRLVAATNRNLEQMVCEGTFRKDLFFRIQAISIELPALRSRTGDVKELAFHYLTHLCESYGTEVKGFSPDFLDALTSYDWPGNVRELMGTLERAIMAARHEPILFPKHLPVNIRIRLKRSLVERAQIPMIEQPEDEEPMSSDGLPQYRDFRSSVLDKTEARYFRELMLRTGGDIQKAIQLSGLGRTQIYSFLKKHGIPRNS